MKLTEHDIRLAKSINRAAAKEAGLTFKKYMDLKPDEAWSKTAFNKGWKNWLNHPKTPVEWKLIDALARFKSRRKNAYKNVIRSLINVLQIIKIKEISNVEKK